MTETTTTQDVLEKRTAAFPLTRAERLVILSSVFFGGAILMGLEILGFRIIGKTFGSALRETSVVISVFMAAMSVGYFGGGRIVDRFPRVATLTTALFVAGLSALPVPMVDALIADRVFESSVPIALHSTIVSFALFFLPTVCLASLSPIAIRLLTRGVEKTGKAAGTTSAVSTIGSIVGSVATAFVLIDFYRSTQRTVIVLALGAFVLSALTSWVSALSAPGRGSSSVVLRGVIVGLLAVALVTLSMQRGPLVNNVEPTGTRVVFEQDSAFHHIIVEDSNGVRRLTFDRSRQSAMSLDDPYEGGFEYTDFFHVPMALNPQARRVLFLGLGGGTGPKRFLRDYPESIVEAVDVDSMVIQVAREYFGLPDSDRLTVVAEDARAYVKRSDGPWDVVVIDVYTTNRYGTAVPAHVTTREFFSEVRSKLAPGGIVVFNCASPTTHPVTQAIARTLREVFLNTVVFTTETTANTEILASDSLLPTDVDSMVTIAERAVQTGRVHMPRLVERASQLIRYSVPPSVPTLTDDFAPVDTLSLSTRDQTGVELPH